MLLLFGSWSSELSSDVRNWVSSADRWDLQQRIRSFWIGGIVGVVGTGFFLVWLLGWG